MTAKSFEFGSDYPADRGGKLFAFHVIKLLMVPMVARCLGSQGCNLIRVIASLEDNQYYAGAVLATDEDLRPMLAVTERTLVAARRRCIQAGWLHYEPGAKGTPSRMWVLVPQHIDLKLRSQNPVQIQAKNYTTSATETATESATTTATRSDTTTDTTTAPSYIPIPNLNPLPGSAGFLKIFEDGNSKTEAEEKTSLKKEKAEEIEPEALNSAAGKQLLIDWEEAYGPRLDEMPDDQVIDIASRRFPKYATAFEKWGVRNRLVRPIVLQALAGFFTELRGVR